MLAAATQSKGQAPEVAATRRSTNNNQPINPTKPLGREVEVVKGGCPPISPTRLLGAVAEVEVDMGVPPV